MPWRVTVRTGPRVEHHDAASLDEALDVLELEARAAANVERRAPVDVRLRTFEPAAQVAARVELAGPRRVRAGVDVRGDGSVEAFTGRLRRRPVAREAGETAYEALRRTLSSVSAEP